MTTPPAGPSPRQEYQASSLVLSSRHSNSIRDSGVWSSVPVKRNVVSLLPLAGALVIVVSGAVVSAGGITSHSYSGGLELDALALVVGRDHAEDVLADRQARVGHGRRCTTRTGPCRASTRTTTSVALAAKSITADVLSVSPPLAGSPFSPGSYAGPDRIVVIRPVIVPVVDGRRLVDVALDVAGADLERVRADLVVLELVLVGVEPGHHHLRVVGAREPRARVHAALERRRPARSTRTGRSRRAAASRAAARGRSSCSARRPTGSGV